VLGLIEPENPEVQMLCDGVRWRSSRRGENWKWLWEGLLVGGDLGLEMGSAEAMFTPRPEMRPSFPLLVVGGG
jgi:hypothetical protein